MKKNKFNAVLGLIAAAVIITIIVIAALPGKNSEGDNTEQTTALADSSVITSITTTALSETETTIMTVSEIVNTDSTVTESTSYPTKIQNTSEATTESETQTTSFMTTETTKTPATTKAPTTTKKTTTTVAKPITTTKAKQTTTTAAEVRPTEYTEVYNCGNPNHHCDGPATHSFITSLEEKGCPYCGKHDCPSFYAVDKWGQACYTPNQCPQYDIHKDPVYYCQDCGKPCGSGSSGTCVKYTVDIKCPYCGENVKAWTCHSCGK